MKKLSIALIAVLVISLSAFATTGPDANPHFAGMANFLKSYPHARVVALEAKGSFVKVSFVYNEKKLEAFYDMDGNMICSSHDISLQDLSAEVRQDIQKEYAGFVVREAIEIDQPDSRPMYYVTVVAPQKLYVLQIDTDGTISVFKKMKN